MNSTKHRRTVVARLMVMLGAAILCAALAPSARAEPPLVSAPALKPRVFLVRIKGDLAYAKMAADFRDRLAEAGRREAFFVIVDLSGQACRADILLDMVHAVHDSPAPVAIRLVEDQPGGRLDPESRVRHLSIHPGLFALGITAQRFGMQPQLRITNESAPDLNAALDAKGREQIMAQLVDLTAVGLYRRGASEEQARGLARAILTPTQPQWLSINETDRTYSMSPDAPASGPDGVSAIRLVSVESNTPAFFSLDSKHAYALRCTDTPQADDDHLLAMVLKDPRTPELEAIDGAAYQARADQAPLKVQSVDNFLVQIEPILVLPDPAKHSVSKDKYRSAGRLALDKLKQSEEELSDLESILRDLPEVLRTAPPGKTDVGAKPSSYAAKWRSIIQTRKDKVAKLRAKAEEFAGQ